MGSRRSADDRTPAQRAAIRAGVWRMSQPSRMFVLMTALSTIIASYGMLSSSAAVVIGAMLIAPLMGPILGVAMGVAIGDTRMFRRALRAELLGVALTVALGVLIGLIPLQLGYGAEVLSRTKPTLYDLIIALAAGVAAAYAVVDERVSPTLPGVAIATALVPPLAASGLCLAGQHWSWAGGAFLLFVANFLAITTVGAATFLIMGIRRPGSDAVVRTPGHARRIAVHVVALVVVGAYMTHTLIGLVRDNRLTDGVRRVLRDEIRTSMGAQLSEVRHERKAGRIEVIATMLTARPFEAGSVERMERALRARVHPGVRLIVRSLVARDSDALGPVFVPDEERERLSAEAERTQQMAEASAVLSRKLASGSGTALVDMALEPDQTLQVAVRTPVPLGPARVAEAEAALRSALGEPIRLVVQSVLVRTADASGYVDDSSGTGAEDETGARERERWARLIQHAARERMAGATVLGLRADVVEARVAVQTVLRAPAAFAPADVGYIEAYLRARAHPAVDLRVRTIVAAMATANGYGVETDISADAEPLGVPRVRATGTRIAADPVLALCVAAAEGNLPAVARIVEGGGGVRATSVLGCTPLHYAVRRSEPAVVAYLLDHGADRDARDHLGGTPDDWASAAGRDETARTLASP